MNDEEMTEKLNEITFCDECPYSGEPNGCNRKEGVCKAHESYFDLVDENATLRKRLEKAVELPVWQKNGEAISLFYRNKDNDICTELYWEDVYYDGVRGDKYAKTRFAEILKMESDL